jgi:hypothetical protein
MHRFASAAATAVLLAATVVFAAPAGAASSTSGAKIVAIYFDSPGSDTGSNASLTAEWVQIRNSTSTTKTLTNWTLRDKSNHVYVLPSFTLRAGATAKIHSGHGTKSAANLYWNQSWYVWNNTGDTAYLRNAAGKAVSTCAYTKASTPKKTC